MDAYLVDGEWIGHASFEGLEAIVGARAARNEALAVLLLSDGVSFATMDGSVHLDRAVAMAWGVGIQADGSSFVAVKLAGLTPEERFVLRLFAPTDLAPVATAGDTTVLELASADDTGSSYRGLFDEAEILVSLDRDGGLRSVLVDGRLSLGDQEADFMLEVIYAAATAPPDTEARPDDEDVTRAFVEYVKTRSAATLDLPGD